MDNKEYELARYVTGELESLSEKTLSRIEKNKFLLRISAKENETLNRHKIRLEHWLRVLERPTAEERENALLEISKMPEKEIMERLIKLVGEGSDYILETKKREPQKIKFYHTITTALGHLEKPEAAEALILNLEQYASVLSKKNHKREEFVEEMEYMVLLAKAFGRCNNKKFYERFEGVQLKIGTEYSRFLSQTKFILQKLSPGFKESPEESNFEFHFKRGVRAYSYEEDDQRAIEEFTKALQYDPLSFEAFLNRGNSYKELGQFQKAIEDYDQALLLNPKDYYALTNRGEVKRKINKTKEALEDFEKAININPNFPSPYYESALLKESLGEFEDALALLKTAKKLSPTHLDVHISIGSVLLKLAKTKEAFQSYNKAVELAPEKCLVYLRRGMAWLQIKNLEKAKEDFEKTLELDPQNAEAYLYRGEVKAMSGNIRGASEDFLESIKLNPKLAEPYYSLGVGATNKKEFDLALEYYEKAIKLRPSYEEAYINRGMIRCDIKRDFVNAIEDFNKAIKLNPKRAISFKNRGVAKINSRLIKEAILDFQKALELEPRMYDLYFIIGQNYQNLGDLGQAILFYEKGLQFIKDPGVRIHVGGLYLQRGLGYCRKKQWEKGKSDFVKAKEYTPETHRTHLEAQKFLGFVAKEEKKEK